MVRTELLRAKSLHAEVSYLKDLQRVGDVKRQHDQQTKAVKEKEHQFWKEAVRGKVKAQTEPAAGPHNAHQTATQLDRMWRAHSQLKEAHQKRETSAQKLQEGLTTLSNSKQRIESLQKLVSKAEKMRANQVESRISEEVAELVTTSRAITTLKKGTLSGESVSERIASGEASPPEQAQELESPLGQNQQQFGQALQAAMSSASNVAPSLAAALPRTEIPSTVSLQATPSIAPMQIQNVAFERSAAGASLSVSASFGTLGPVGMTISKSESGGFKVVVDPGANALAGQLLRDKTAIQSRLQALGIKVSSLEVAELESSPQQARRNSRRLSTDPDEELVA